MSTRLLAGLTVASAVVYSLVKEGDRARQTVVQNNGSTPTSDGMISTDKAAASAKPVPASPGEAKPVPIKRELTAAEFNASQDSSSLKKCLDGLQSFKKAGEAATATKKKDAAESTPLSKQALPCDVELYQFLSCPYCAKVKGVLDYHGIPHKTVTVDPITFRHMPATPYTMVPQLQFVHNRSAPEGSQARGPIVVDSDAIIGSLAAPLGFEKQLSDERVVGTRRWINEAYARSSFVALYSTWGHGFEAYRHMVPAQYQYLPLRVAGCSFMYFIASKKVFPRLFEHTDLKQGETVESLIQRQKEQFTQRFATASAGPSSVFHGGKVPDIADVEMFALTRSLLQHDRTRTLACEPKDTAFGVWLEKMTPLMKDARTGNRGSELP